jgi:phasin
VIETTMTHRKEKSKLTPITPNFELPKFEFPNFDLSNLEVPTSFHKLSEDGVAQAKEAFKHAKTAAEEASDVIEDTYAAIANGTTTYNLRVIEAVRANTIAAVEFAGELLDVKTVSELVELSAAHARKQFETLFEQTKQLTQLAQKLTVETAEPAKTSMTKAYRKVA